MSQLTVGIVSGVISAVLLGTIWFIIRLIWKVFVGPWWENTLYRDARIDGQWTATLLALSTENDKEIVSITQTGHNVEGTMRCVNGPDEGREYRFQGVVRNQILSCYYWNNDKTSIDSGSFSLRLEGDGALLSGHTVYYNCTENSLFARAYRWTRDGAAQ